MSLLRGKTVSYSRVILPPGTDPRLLEQFVSVSHFSPLELGGHRLWTWGACSWRSLLDGPIDSGLVNGDPEIWACGIRADSKKAPATLVQAEQARAVADYLSCCGGKIDRKRIREIKAETKAALDAAAPAVPKAGVLAVLLSPGVAILDAPGSALAEIMTKLQADHLEYPPRFLDWLVWSGLRRDEEGLGALWPSGAAAMEGIQDARSTVEHHVDVGPFVSAHWGAGYRVTRARFVIVQDGQECSFTLQENGRVAGLEFPEAIRTGGTDGTEGKLHRRLLWVAGVERLLVGLAADWGRLIASERIPGPFLEQVGGAM